MLLDEMIIMRSYIYIYLKKLLFIFEKYPLSYNVWNLLENSPAQGMARTEGRHIDETRLVKDDES